MLTPGYLVLFILAIIFAIGLLALLITLCVVDPKSDVIGPQMAIQTGDPTVPNGINQAYANSPTGSFELKDDNTKPFVVRMTRDGQTQNAFMFSDIGTFTSQTQYASTGFTFAVNNPTTLVSLQVIDQCFTEGTRQVGIFDATSGAILASASVSKTLDGLVSGFRTHALSYQDQVVLTPFTLYACVGVVQPDDFAVQDPADNGFALPINNILMDSTKDESKLGVGKVGYLLGQNLTLPTNFTQRDLTSPFCSFQVQQKQILLVNVFQVDAQSATFPLSFVRNLNFEVTDPQTIQVQSGQCASVYGDTNLFLPNVSTLSLENEVLISNTWYAVFVAAAQTVPPDPNNCTVLISKYYPEFPTITNNFVRRIGFVRTKNDPTQIYETTQSGNATNRTYAYKDPSETAISIPNTTDGVVVGLDLNLVPPTCTTCTFQVEVETSTSSLTNLSVDIGTTASLIFRDGQTYQLQTVTIPLSSSMIPQAVQITTHMSGPGTASFTFTILYYTEDL